jgi:class I fructose-bisphosphate aldolase
MAVTDRSSPGTRPTTRAPLTNLARLLNHGALAGTGKLVILPVDQGFEHGPARSFAKNPAGYDPTTTSSSPSTRAATPTRRRSASSRRRRASSRASIPLILKLNNSDSLAKMASPKPAVTGSVDDALRLGCAASASRSTRLGPAQRDVHGAARDRRSRPSEGPRVVVWSYPRGAGLSKKGETAIDVCAYAAQIAAQLGAHIIKVKPPTAHIEQDAAKKVYEKREDPDRHARRPHPPRRAGAFGGRRIVIFSGGEAKGTDAVLAEIKGSPPAARSARSWAATPSSARAPRRSSCSPT